VLRIHGILGWSRIRIRGSMPLTNGSGSGSCYFRHWPSRCQQKLIFNTIFSAYYFLKVHLHHFSKIKSQKESSNSRNQGFSCYFCVMIEGSGSGSIPLTSGFGSGRPKNMWIRIRNTDYFPYVGNNLRGQVVVVFPVSFCVMYSNQILRQKFTKIRFCEPFIFAFLDPENPDEIRI
jgi:hypothetical protein